MNLKTFSSFLDEPDLSIAPLQVQALVLRCRAGYLHHGYLPDDPRAASAIARVQVADMLRWWNQVRGFFTSIGESLTDHTVEVLLHQQEKADTARRANGALGGRPRKPKPNLDETGQVSSRLAPGSVQVSEPLAHDLEHAHDAGPRAYVVSNSSTKDLSTSFSPAVCTAGLDAPEASKRSRKSRALSPVQARELSLREFDWTQDHETQVQLARKGYPSNTLRRHRDGTTSRCLPGTPEQTRKAWKEILLDHPELTPRILKTCLFLYLDRQERDQEQNITSGIVNLPKFWCSDLKMWEEFLPEARARVAKAIAEERGELPLEVLHA